MIAGKADLSEALPGGLHIPQVLPGDGRQANDGVHRRANVVGHGGKEVRLGLVGGFRLPDRDLEAAVEVEHVEHVEQEQDQQAGGHHADQQPVLPVHMEVLRRHEAQQRPPDRGGDGGKGEDALLAPGIEHGNGARRSGDPVEQCLRRSGIGGIAGLIELKEAGILEAGALEDVIAVGVDHGELGVRQVSLGEDPLPLELRDGHDAHQDRVLGSFAPRIAQRDPVAEGQGLFAVHRVGKGAGHVDRLADLSDPAHVLQQPQPVVGNGIVVGGALLRAGGKTRECVQRNQVRRSVCEHVGGANVIDHLLHGHLLAVDVSGPHIADVLLALQVILRHVFDGDRRIHEIIDLPLIGVPALQPGIRHDKDQYGGHNDRVDNANQSLLHVQISLESPGHERRNDSICAGGQEFIHFILL